MASWDLFGNLCYVTEFIFFFRNIILIQKYICYCTKIWKYATVSVNNQLHFFILNTKRESMDATDSTKGQIKQKEITLGPVIHVI